MTPFADPENAYSLKDIWSSQIEEQKTIEPEDVAPENDLSVHRPEEDRGKVHPKA
jgi:hypothetical protein